MVNDLFSLNKETLIFRVDHRRQDSGQIHELYEIRFKEVNPY